jgi:low temperature requirement protein LtrA
VTGNAADEPVVESVDRVSTLELFFDLVFVFTITQLSTLLVDQIAVKHLVQVVLMLGLIWWMYDGYAWLTNAVPPDRMIRRVALLGAMCAFLVLALAIPGAFTGSGLTFGLAYLAVVLIHWAVFANSASVRITQAIFGLLPYNLLSAVLVLVGGALGGTPQYVLWALAFVFEWSTPRLADITSFTIAPAHFVERHGLVVIIAIGESVVAVGIGAHGLAIKLSLVGVAVMGLLLSACLWWAYFGSGDAERAEEAIERARPERRAQMGVYGYGWWHIAILLGVIAIAGTMRHAIGHASIELTIGQAVMLGGGAAVFMLGDVMFRWVLGIGRGVWRLAAAAFALATIPLGTEVSAVTQLVVIVVLLAAALAAEAAPEASYLSGRSG